MKISIPFIIFIYLSVNVFSQKYVIQVKDAEKNKWSYVNIDGEYIIPYFYKKCFEFDESGYAAVYDKKKRQYMFIDTAGNMLETEVKGFQLKNVLGFGVKGFVNGYVAVKKNDKWGFLNTMGKLAVDLKYEKVNVMNEGYSAAKYENNWVIIDGSGNESKPEINNIDDIRLFVDGLAPFKTTDKKMGFINPEGKIIIHPEFKAVGYFSAGLAWVRTFEDKIGFIDKEGNRIILPQYTDARNFDHKSGIAKVRKADNWIYIDKTGNKIQLNLTLKKEDFSEGLCPGKSNGLWGFYNKNNKWVIQPQFQNIRPFKNNFAAVKRDELWGLINNKGEWVIPPKFAAVKDVERVK